MKKNIYTLAICGTMAAIGIGLLKAEDPVRSPEAAMMRNLTTLSSIMNELQSLYVDSVKVDEVMTNGINAMLSQLDPYTEYFTEKEQITFNEHTTGEYGGIGVRIRTIGRDSYFDKPTAGSPAERAGIRYGDRIVRIDTVTAEGKSSTEIVNLVRGIPGTEVSITVSRPYATDTLPTLTLKRERLSQPAIVYANMLNSGIGIISLSTFSERAAEEVRAQVNEFKKDPAFKGLILDLTGNGGGLLSQAVDIVSIFVPKGTKILETKGRNPQARHVYRTSTDPVLPDMPLIVLIDSGSASASEVVAGALQDLDRAVLVGERSFGKGLVQSTRPLRDGALLKLTTSKYYIPSGRLIQALDYSHRNNDGTAYHMPDSLTGTFYTSVGRPVKDGGGLKPDVLATDSALSEFSIGLLNSKYPHSFVRKYIYTHPEAKSVKDLQLNDSIRNEFTEYIESVDYKYNSRGHAGVNTLSGIIKEENRMTPQIQAQLDSIARQLSPNLATDLRNNYADYSPFLLAELANAYYGDKGFIEVMYRYRADLKKALELLQNPTEYNKILASPATQQPVKTTPKKKKRK